MLSVLQVLFSRYCPLFDTGLTIGMRLLYTSVTWCYGEDHLGAARSSSSSKHSVLVVADERQRQQCTCLGPACSCVSLTFLLLCVPALSAVTNTVAVPCSVLVPFIALVFGVYPLVLNRQFALAATLYYTSSTLVTMVSSISCRAH